MVLKWRRAFCTSVSKEGKEKEKSQPTPPGLGSRLVGFFSNPSTPRVQSKVQASSPSLRCRSVDTFPAVNASMPSNSAPQSPKLRCKTKESPSFFRRSSAASSPRSPSAFSLLSLGIGTSKSRCGVCLQKVKSGLGTAIFTAECGHSFHFPCIASRVKKDGALTCPICNSTWKEMHNFSSDESSHGGNRGDTVPRDFNAKNDARCMLKVYNDDEPLSSPTFGARFNPILESDELEEEGNDEFPGFFVSGDLTPVETKRQNLEMSLSEAAVISAGKSGETYVVVLRIKAPTAPVRRPPIDLVAVLNVGRSMTADKIQLMKKAMKLIVTSLSTTDRLSIVAFSTASKRLLPLRRMNTAGKRSARRIIDAVVALDTAATCATDSIKKAAKVLSDRREKNPSAAIILLSDGQFNAPFVSSTAFASIPLHTVNLNASINAPLENDFFKSITALLVVQDLSIHFGFPSTASPAEISAVYSCKNTPSFLGSSSGWCRIGDFHSDEEREFLIELRSKTSLQGAQGRVLSIRYSYKDPSTQQSVSDNERSPLPIPHPRAAGSSSTRLRCLFLTTRAVAESTRLVERNDVAGAHRMLASARALVRQMGSGAEFVRLLEAELAELELIWRKSQWQQEVRENSGHDRRETGHVEEKGEALTPTSAWRAAERLAKVAIMRKSLNRVSDLHGFESARF